MLIYKFYCSHCKSLLNRDELIEQYEYYLHTEIDDGKYETFITYMCPKCYSSDCLKEGLYDTETEKFSD